MKNKKISFLPGSFIMFWSTMALGQTGTFKGSVSGMEGGGIEAATVSIPKLDIGTLTDNKGKYDLRNIPYGTWTFMVSYIGYETYRGEVTIDRASPAIRNISLQKFAAAIDEVVITGVTRATLIRENPVAIRHVSHRDIAQTTEPNIIEVLVRHVPGLNAVKTGPNIAKPFIRGLGYNRVLTLFDGIRQEGQQWGDEHGIEVDAYNIDRAEVIRGPASIMYGSDALAGVVSLFSPMAKEQETKLHGKYYGEYQSNNGLIGNGMLLTYANSHWSYALRGSYRIAKNYQNHIDGRVYNTGFREGNVSASIRHSSDAGYSSLNLTLYDNLQGIPDGSRDSLTRKFTQQIDEGDDDDIKNRPVVPGKKLNSYDLSPLHQHIRHYRIYSNNQYTVGGSDINFSLAYQRNMRREYNHPTKPQQAGMFVGLNTVNYSLGYNAPERWSTRISAGLNGMYQRNKSKDATDFPIPDYTLFDVGGYLYAKWKQDKWTVSGGLRYDIRRLQGNNFYTITDPGTDFSMRVQAADTADAYLRFPAFSKIFHGVSLSLGATYKISRRLSLKANIARGYRAPNITEFASNGLDPGAHIVYLGNRKFIPEFSLQEDLGIDFYEKSISASASVFNNNIENYIYLAQLTDERGLPIADPQGNKTYQYQQAAAQLYGLEATFNLHPANWKGFTFNNAWSVIYGFNRKKEYKGNGINGSYLPLIPPFKWLSHIHRHLDTKSKFVNGMDIKFEMEYNAPQNRYLALDHTETATPGYVLFNAGINTNFRYGREKGFTVQLQVNNLLDRDYQSNLSRLKYFEYYDRSPDGHLGIYNMGRNICIKLIMPF